MSTWGDNKIMELIGRVEALEARLAAVEAERADEKKPDRASEPKRANAR